jgi:hypothetical protein
VVRARAQKRKKVSSEAEESHAARPRAAQPAAEVAADRPAPDPQQPPVVAPVLMPSVGLEVPTEELAVVVGAIASGGAKPSATETDAAAEDAPVAVEQKPAADAAPPKSRRTFTLPYDQEEAATPPVALPRAEPVAQTDAADDATWRAPDEARLLVQSPRKLFLYWRFARDPRELLREALGPVAERMSPAVRLVDVSSGEEGEAAAAEGSDYWFDVLPGRLLRADVGFRGEGLPFVRLISSNTVETPAVGVSRVEDEAPQFRVPEQEFERVLEATGFEAGEWQEESARRDASDQNDNAGRLLDFPPHGATVRDDEPLRPRATSDPRPPTSSPRDGGHFSNTRGGELF